MYRHYWFCKSGTLIHEYYLILFELVQEWQSPQRIFARFNSARIYQIPVFCMDGTIDFRGCPDEEVGFSRVHNRKGTFHLSVLRYQWPFHKCHGTLKHVGSAADSTLKPNVEPTWSIWQDSLEVPWTAVFGLLKACLSSHCFLSSLTRAAGIEMGNES